MIDITSLRMFSGNNVIWSNTNEIITILTALIKSKANKLYNT